MGTVRSKPISVGIDTRPPSAREPFPLDELRTRSTALAAALAPLPLDQRLQLMRREVRGPIVFTTSFGLEDQVILHALRQHRIDVEIVTLDTGRLFPETLRRLDGERATLRHPHPLDLSAARRGRSVGRRARDQRLLSFARRARGVLPRSQGRAAQSRARRRRGLDHRPEVGPVGRAPRRRVGQCRLGPRHSQIQSALRLDARGGAELHPRARRSGQRPACQGLRLHRLRPVHARHRARRERARRPLVVGRGRQEGMRPARAPSARAALDIAQATS